MQLSKPYQPKRVKPKEKGKKDSRLLPISVGILVTLLAILLGYTFLYPQIHFGIKAGGVSVGGLSQEDATGKITGHMQEVLQAHPDFLLTIEGKEYPIAAGQIGLKVEDNQTAQRAWLYTREGNPFERIAHTVQALFLHPSVALDIQYDGAKLQSRLDAIEKQAIRPPKEPSWKVVGDVLRVDRGTPGMTFSLGQIQEELLKHFQTMDFHPIEVPVQVDPQQPIDVQAIAKAVNTTPKNATVDKQDGKTVLPSVDGIVLQTEQAEAILQKANDQEQTLNFPIVRTPASVSSDELQKVLFRDVLASSSTNFHTSGASRANNVRLATAKMNGTILNPGESFSYNGTVGKRTAERGFAMAGAYVGGKLVDEVGGGVCQPSSTLYMAVLRADLKVTERVNHGFTVAYTPLGEDATVSYGAVDFQFVNDTPYPVKILASTHKGVLTMQLIGTKTSDKKVTIEREILSTTAPQTVEKPDATLPVGQKQVEQKGQTGYKVVTYKKIVENGTTKREKIGVSNYKKKDEIIHIGTKPVEPAPATPSEGDGTATGEVPPKPPAESDPE